MYFLSGHTYPENDIIIPNILIDNMNIIFEPALPEMDVFTNFKITNKGCMPAMFKFVQPRSR